MKKIMLLLFIICVSTYIVSINIVKNHIVKEYDDIELDMNHIYNLIYNENISNEYIKSEEFITVNKMYDRINNFKEENIESGIGINKISLKLISNNNIIYNNTYIDILKWINNNKYNENKDNIKFIDNIILPHIYNKIDPTLNTNAKEIDYTKVLQNRRPVTISILWKRLQYIETKKRVDIFTKIYDSKTEDIKMLKFYVSALKTDYEKELLNLNTEYNNEIDLLIEIRDNVLLIDKSIENILKHDKDVLSSYYKVQKLIIEKKEYKNSYISLLKNIVLSYNINIGE